MREEGSRLFIMLRSNACCVYYPTQHKKSYLGHSIVWLNILITTKESRKQRENISMTDVTREMNGGKTKVKYLISAVTHIFKITSFQSSCCF